MKPRRLSILLLAITVGLSCNDHGDVVNYLEVIEVQPAPNSTHVDKAATVLVRLTRGVRVDEAGKIHVQYVDDATSVNSYPGCGLTPPIDDRLCVGPFMWKAGSTVEISIPKDLSDPDGNSLKHPLVYRFTIARDTIPFDLQEISRGQSDTISLSQTSYASFMMIFNDYVLVRDSMLTVDPPATLSRFPYVICEGRSTPQRNRDFLVRDLRPFTKYTVTIPHSIKDYEGEELPRDYHVFFHTKP